MILRSLIQLSRPLNMLFAALAYWLGAGIARYLGAYDRVHALWLGLFGVVLAQLSMDLLSEVFLPLAESQGSDLDPEERRLVRAAALYASIAALAALGLVAFALRAAGGLGGPVLLSMALSLFVILLYAVPPLRLQEQGLGEILLAIQIAYLAPSIGFLLQAGSYHALPNVCSIALTMLLIASFLALGLPTYATDLKMGRSTLLLRLGWESGLKIHHSLIITAYLLLLVVALLQRSLPLFAPAFLAVPFALLQIFILRGIALGARPIWSLVRANAIAVFVLTSYSLALGFWLR